MKKEELSRMEEQSVFDDEISRVEEQMAACLGQDLPISRYMVDWLNAYLDFFKRDANLKWEDGSPITDMDVLHHLIACQTDEEIWALMAQGIGDVEMLWAWYMGIHLQPKAEEETGPCYCERDEDKAERMLNFFLDESTGATESVKVKAASLKKVSYTMRKLGLSPDETCVHQWERKYKPVALKIFDVKMWLYDRLYVKENAGGGLNEEEFIELKNLFMNVSHHAISFLSDFYQYGTGTKNRDIDTLIDYAAEKGIIQYSSRWKTLYHELRSKGKESCMVSDDKQNILDMMELFGFLKKHVIARYIVETETGGPCEESPELYRLMMNYGPSLINDYPGVSYTEQVTIYDDIYRISMDVEDPECQIKREFDEKMERLMKDRGLTHHMTPLIGMQDKIQGDHGEVKFQNEIEREVLLALQEEREVGFRYFSMEDGNDCWSQVWTTPIKLRLERDGWILVGKDEDNQVQEYIVRLILCVTDNGKI